MKKIILIVCLIISDIYAQNKDIFVTKMSSKVVDNQIIAEVTLNDKIKIKDIKVVNENGKFVLKYPEYETKRGKVYPKIKILSEELNNKIKESIMKGILINKLDGKNEIEWEISKFNINKVKSSLKAFASVRFNNQIEIECNIFETQKKLWISWPSKQNPETGKWVKEVVFRKNLKEQIDKCLLDRYKTIKEEIGDNKFESEEEWE
jgi:DNA-binding cell septation regulator SpoVG